MVILMDNQVEYIEAIKEDTFDGMDGYRIYTNNQEIFLGIYNTTDCCENWGYMTSEDSFEGFIGSTLLDIKEVDSAYNVTSFKETSIDSGDAMFINIETSKGVLQFVLYNEHNGYYGHSYRISSTQLFKEGNI